MPTSPTGAPVALVTGSARRLGAATVRRLHAEGFQVAIHCRNSRAQADALARELEQARPGSILVLQADLAQSDRLPGLVAGTVDRFGRLDALVNNASAFFPTPVGDTTPAQWDTLLASNARAPFFLAQAAAPHLRQSRGAIVNMVDLYAERPLAGHTVYCMAKAALLAMTRSLALELAPQVRVNAVSPGAILWPEEGGEDEARRDMLERTPMDRTGTPEEIASAVHWLLREATYSTGQVLYLDGGRRLPG
ncbi:pteridine reductase [Lysobacter sp. GX 14042]|uniref:pteridine reductase n=1 Tax=Lysobacter sp. GX 14042 TaxID=2907155 RepID=UPI001F17A596|nr:pteridine reductase [Lysobacter sp. GX 14042]MCE7033441.1 pteridine reductase [Lysobacter sp. GX 14042]